MERDVIQFKTFIRYYSYKEDSNEVTGSILGGCRIVPGSL